MMKKNLLINLPEDVFINNILLNSKVLPIKSLLSLRCVCKYLRKLITSPAFINMQLHHSTTNQLLNNNPLVLIKATHRPNLFFSLKFNVGDDDPCCPDVVEFVSPMECSKIWDFCKGMECFKFCGSCNGLVCLAKRTNVCLWNPFTKEYKVLPPPLPFILKSSIGVSRHSVLNQLAYGFGYDRLLDDYKIIRCSEHFLVPKLPNNSDLISVIQFQVYALGTNTWRKISTDNNPYKAALLLESSVFVNGAFHWVISTSEWKSSGGMEAKIVSLDIEKEVFGDIQTPSMLMAKFKPYVKYWSIIQVLRGCLCVVVEHDYRFEACNVWMMMDYGVKESWTKLFSIFKTQDYYIRISPESYKLLRFCENGTEILVVSHNSLIVYDLINNTSKSVEFGEKMGKWKYQSEVYIESLVSLNSGVYSKQKRNENSIEDE